MSIIKEKRKKLGLSQTALAEKAGVSQRAVAKWERNGIGKAQLDCIVKIANALGCKVDDLL